MSIVPSNNSKAARYGRFPASFMQTLPRMTDAAKAVAMALAWHAALDWTCYPSLPTLQAETGLQKRGVQNGIKWLEAAGVLTVQRGSGRGRASVYRLAEKVQEDAPFEAGKGARPCAEKVHDGARKGAPARQEKVQEDAPQQLSEQINEQLNNNKAVVGAAVRVALMSQGVRGGGLEKTVAKLLTVANDDDAAAWVESFDASNASNPAAVLVSLVKNSNEEELADLIAQAGAGSDDDGEWKPAGKEQIKSAMDDWAMEGEWARGFTSESRSYFKGQSKVDAEETYQAMTPAEIAELTSEALEPYPDISSNALYNDRNPSTNRYLRELLIDRLRQMHAIRFNSQLSETAK